MRSIASLLFLIYFTIICPIITVDFPFEEENCDLLLSEQDDKICGTYRDNLEEFVERGKTLQYNQNYVQGKFPLFEGFRI